MQTNLPAALSKQLSQQLQQAMQAHSSGRLDVARHLYQAVLAHAPRHFDALHHLGMVETQTGNLPGAVQLFEQAAQVDPRTPDVHNNLAYALQRMGKPQEALTSYERALRIRPDDLDVLNNLGQLLRSLNRHEDSLRVYDQALAVGKRFIDILSNRGNTLLALGRPTDALQSFDEALRLSPANPTVLNNRSIALAELMRYDEAVQDASAAIAARPDYADAWLNRGNAYRSLGHSALARADYEKASALRPTDARAQQNLAALMISSAEEAPAILASSRRSLDATLDAEFRQPLRTGTGFGPEGTGISRFRLRHDMGQARWLLQEGVALPALKPFLSAASDILARTAQQPDLSKLALTAQEQAAIAPYLGTLHVHEMPKLAHVLNPEHDWARIEREYFSHSPELLYIDDFLTPQALQAFYDFNLQSRVWLEEYTNQYLGAFGSKGFASPLHLQLARELRAAMPGVFKEHLLNQLWGFKYDATLDRGINVHADFAAVNLNFWITPDRYNLDPAKGGLKVYDIPAPTDWSFQQYNTAAADIHAHLASHGARAERIAYRCNRAVLFNSALFHETDELRFADEYAGRRVNMTYLFGRQLA